MAPWWDDGHRHLTHSYRCNRISTLACSPATFPSLIALDVSFNQACLLTGPDAALLKPDSRVHLQIDPHSLPHLGSIPTLRTLNLSSNGITELTNGLQNLPNITTLILDGNRLSQACQALAVLQSIAKWTSLWKHILLQLW